MRLIGLAVALAVSLTVASFAAGMQPEEKIYRVGRLSAVVDPDHQKIADTEDLGLIPTAIKVSDAVRKPGS